jgi:hypothetical protein
MPSNLGRRRATDWQRTDFSLSLRSAALEDSVQMHMRATVVPFLAVLALGLKLGAKAPVSFDDAVKAADANAATSDGKVYAAEVARHFSEQHATSLKECSQASGDAEKVPFTLALRVGKKGLVEQVLVKPETRTGLCMARTTVKDHLKKPPTPGHWVKVTLTPTP